MWVKRGMAPGSIRQKGADFIGSQKSSNCPVEFPVFLFFTFAVEAGCSTAEVIEGA